MKNEGPSDVVLAHYGIPGMKWGVRRDRDRPGGADGKSNGDSAPSKKGGKGSESSAKKGKPSSSEIKEARARQEARLRKVQEAEGDYYTSVSQAGQDKAQKSLAKYGKQYMDNPDVEVANMMTRGEKVVTGIALVGYGLLAASAVIAIGES